MVGGGSRRGRRGKCNGGLLLVSVRKMTSKWEEGGERTCNRRERSESINKKKEKLWKLI